MTRRRALIVAVAVAGWCLATAAPAFAHAVLLHAVPVPSQTLNSSPPDVALTFDEAIEPRFATISVTDAAGHQQAAGSLFNPPGSPQTIETKVLHLPPGWYLVYYRVISADGHPVRGAFTFAVGPNPGPPPQFRIPSLTESSVTPQLISTRWIAFLAILIGVGLLVMRTFVARPAIASVPEIARRLDGGLTVAVVVGLIVVPVYVLFATAQFALRSSFDVSGLVPLMRDSALGRAWLDLELVLALFGLSALLALRLDPGDRRHRSVAQLLAVAGALVGAASLLAVPGLAGHAAQTPPTGVTLPADWIHLASISVWLGGLVGLALIATGVPAGSRLQALGTVVPRFSRVALVAVLVIIASGTTEAIVHLPTLQSLWQTSYGQAILAKIALLVCAMLVANVNRTRSSPRLRAALSAGDQPAGGSARRLLGRMVGGEIVLVSATVLAAAILTSLPPPAAALAEAGSAQAHVGPGSVRSVLTSGPYRIVLSISPNKAVAENTYRATVTRHGQPLDGAIVIAHFAMLDMEMGSQEYEMHHIGHGIYQLSSPAQVMVGHWLVGIEVDPPGHAPAVLMSVVDEAEG